MNGTLVDNRLLWDILWQTTLCLGVGVMASIVWRKHSARAHQLLLLAIVAAVVTPVLGVGARQLGLGLFAAPGMIAAPGPVAEGHNRSGIAVGELGQATEGPSSNRSDPTAASAAQEEGEHIVQHAAEAQAQVLTVVFWGTVGLAAWGVVSGLALLRLGVMVIGAVRIIAEAERLEDERLTRAAAIAGARLGIRHQPEIRSSVEVPAPMIWCWRQRPLLLVPKEALSHEDINWQAVFGHELAHWKRRDHWSALLADIVACLIPWQPLAWWAKQRLATLSEMACDEWAIQSGTLPADYAETLLNLMPSRQQSIALCAVSKRSLPARIKRILGNVGVQPRAGVLWVCIASLFALSASTLISVAQTRPATLAAGEGATNRTAEKAVAQPDTIVNVQGRVLGPKGKAIEGAMVRMFDDSEPVGESVTTNAEGRFRITFDKSKFSKPDFRRYPWQYARLTANAEGFGAAWVDGLQLDKNPHPTLRLVEDNVPLQGRVLNLEGQPVARATLHVLFIRADPSNSLNGFLAAVRDQPATSNYENEHMSYLPAGALKLNVTRGQLHVDDRQPVITTDAKGRFEVRGFGRERVVHMTVEGTDIQREACIVLTRAKIDDRFKRGRLSDATKRMVQAGARLPSIYTASFTHVGGPSRPVSGVVRGGDTKKPLAGVTVFAESRGKNVTGVAKTDENGQYELRGLATEGSVRFYIQPAKNQPYVCMERQMLKFSTQSAAKSVDFELPRGVMVRGRVVNAKTGEGIKANVHYFGSLENPHVEKLTDQLGSWNRVMSDAQGEYHFVVLPGAGAIAARVMGKKNGEFRRAKTEDFGLAVDSEGLMATANRGLIRADPYDVAESVDPAEDAKELRLDLRVYPGQPPD